MMNIQEKFRHEPYAVEIEQALLGSLLLDNRLIDTVSADLEADAFYDPLHQRLYEMIVHLQTEGAVTPLIVASVLKADAGLLEVGGHAYLAGLAEAAPAGHDVQRFSKLLRELSMRRSIIRLGEDIVNSAYEPPHEMSAQQIASDATESLLQITSAVSRPVLTGWEIAQETMQEIEDAAMGKPVPIVKTGIQKLDEELGGFRGGDFVVIAGKSGMGKAQPLAEPVLMRDGNWRPIGDMRLGDELASVDGAKSYVSGLFPQGSREIYRVTFSDGRSTEVCGDHLWAINVASIWGQSRILSTMKLLELLQQPSFRNRLSVPMVSGNFGTDQELPVDPYVLGVLLGDGSFRGSTPRLTSADEEILEAVRARLTDDMVLQRVVGSYAYSLKGASGGYKFGHGRALSSLTGAVASLGLMGVRSEGKFVPRCYLHASKEVRLDILRGLIDTDGWVEKHGSVRFCTTSAQLAEDVEYLVRSVGGTCSRRARQTHFTVRGVKKAGKPSFVCRIRHAHAEELMLLSRKRSRATRTRNSFVNLNVRSIELLCSKECVCISVTHPSNLYVTRDFVVTHNTALLSGIARNTAAAGVPTLVLSLEMVRRQWIERMVCDIDFDEAEKPMRYGNIRKLKMVGNEFSRFGEIANQLHNWPFEIRDEDNLTMQQIASVARAFKAKHGGKIGIVFLDYLQIINPGDARDRSREQTVNSFARGCKSLAKLLNWPVVAGSQMNEGAEHRGADEKRPQASDVRESKGIMNEADVILSPYRLAYFIQNRRPADLLPGDPRMQAYRDELTACLHRMDLLGLKNRHGARFDLELWCDMASNAVRSEQPYRFGNIAQRELSEVVNGGMF